MRFETAIKRARILKLAALPTLALSVVIPAVVIADSKQADACATKLSADQMLIFRTAKPAVTPSSDMISVVRPKVIALVAAEKLSDAAAPDDALAAARCLGLMQQ